MSLAARSLRALSLAIGERLERVPIRLKLALAFASVMVVLFGVMFLVLYARFADGMQSGVDASLSARAADLTLVAARAEARLASHPLLPGSAEGFAQIIAPDGRILAHTPGIASRPLLSADQVADTRAGPVEIQLGSRAQLRAYRVRGAGGTAVEANVLVVGVSLAGRNGVLRSLQTWLFVGGPIALLLACAAGYAVAAKALAPVERMRRRAAEIYGFKAGERLPVPPAHDEIRRLGETLNEMLARVDEVVGRGRAFVAGASHELRTPLTILQLELDDALAGGRSHEELEAMADSAREEVRRLTSLTEDLLVIAQTDADRLPLNTERFDVRGAMRVVADRFAQVDGLTGRRVVVEPGEAVMIEADIARIDQVLSNLVHNALRHGGGIVVMRAVTRGAVADVHVLDDGPGFARDFLPHAFERFSQGDPARAGAGTGLGLAIVCSIAEAHGGRAGARNRPEGGADVWLTLPAATIDDVVEPGGAGAGEGVAAPATATGARSTRSA